MNDEEREYLNEMIRSLNNRLVDALRERDEAQREVARLLDVETGHRIAIANLTAERDEARRDLCYAEAADLSVAEAYNPRPIPYHPSQAHKMASERGWDCFKDEPKS
jgi:hypothetical protein